MRACPQCQKAYSAGEETCPADGAALVDDREVSLSDTIASAATASGGAVTPAPTPAPIVRSNPTPTPSLRESLSEIGIDSVVGTTLAGRYHVTRKIGEGGMGVVYEGRHSLIGKRVAIKVLLDKYTHKADVVARLQQEARLASSIGHEHIVDITDFGETSDGRTFVVMEFLEGESLAQLLQREGPLPPLRAVGIARQVASALGAAHGKGVIHRDIKPENVFITQRSSRDFVKVVDFGISKAMRPAEDDEGGIQGSSPRLTHTGMVLGTPLYMSPEQARGEDDLDHRIDVYAVGVILYELITGEVPFRGTNYLSIISQVLSQDPRAPSEVRPDLSLSPALEAVVLRAMAKDRTVRYQSMTELDADLARVEKGDEVAAAVGSLPMSRLRAAPRKGTKLKVLLWVAGIAVLIAATAAIVGPLVAKSSGPKQTAEAAPAPPPQPAPQPPQQPAVAPPAPPVQETITIRVESKPPGASIFWDDTPMGETPREIDFPKGGEYITLTLKLDGFEDATMRFTTLKNATIPVPLKKLKGKRPPKPDDPPPKVPPGDDPDRHQPPPDIPPNPFGTKKPQ